MGELYRMMGGDEISKYYEGMRQAQLDTLMAKFAEIDEQGGVPIKQKKQAPKPKEEIIETHIGKAGAQPKKQAAPAKR